MGLIKEIVYATTANQRHAPYGQYASQPGYVDAPVYVNNCERCAVSLHGNCRGCRRNDRFMRKIVRKEMRYDRRHGILGSGVVSLIGVAYTAYNNRSSKQAEEAQPAQVPQYAQQQYKVEQPQQGQMSQQSQDGPTDWAERPRYSQRDAAPEARNGFFDVAPPQGPPPSYETSCREQQREEKEGY